MDLDWSSSVSAYRLLFRALSLIPISHYLLFASLILIVLLYRFLEFHFLQDLFSLFADSPVALTFHPASDVYDGVVSKCRILHGSYLATPWLSSPHLQTVFLNFFGRPPFFKYRRSSPPFFLQFLCVWLGYWIRSFNPSAYYVLSSFRQLFTTPDGGTVALDWLMSSDGTTVYRIFMFFSSLFIMPAYLVVTYTEDQINFGLNMFWKKKKEPLSIHKLFLSVGVGPNTHSNMISNCILYDSRYAGYQLCTISKVWSFILMCPVLVQFLLALPMWRVLFVKMNPLPLL